MTQSQQIIINDVASGAVTPLQGARVLEMVDHRRKGIETQDLAERMDALEGNQN